MTVPKHHELMVDAAFLATGNEGVSEFVWVMIGEQPLERGTQSIDVDALCLFEVHEVLHLFEHRGERYVSQGDISAHAFLARFAFEGVAVLDFYGRQFALPESEVEKHEQRARYIVFSVSAVLNKLFLFLFCECRAFLAFVIRQDDLLHRGREIEVLRCHVEDTAEHEFEFLCRPVLSRLHKREEILLHERTGNLRKVQMPERRTQIDFEHTGVFLEGGRFRRLFLEFEPVFGIIRKENGLGSPSLGIGNGDILYLGLPDEFLDEFLFHRVEVFGGDLDVISLPAVAGLEQPLIIAELYDSVVIDECFLKRFRHRFQLLFGER